MTSLPQRKRNTNSLIIAVENDKDMSTANGTSNQPRAESARRSSRSSSATGGDRNNGNNGSNNNGNNNNQGNNNNNVVANNNNNPANNNAAPVNGLVCDMRPFPQHYQQISVLSLRTEEQFEAVNYGTNRFILAVLLQIKYNSDSSKQYSFTAASRFKSPNDKFAKKTSMSKPFSRMLSFGCLHGENGKMFYVIESHAQDKSRHWRYGTSSLSIGSTIAIPEPDEIENYISDDLPIVTNCLPFYIISNYRPQGIPMSVRYNIGTQRFFCLHGLGRADLRFLKFTPDKAVCAGSTCDRQGNINIGSETKICGCYQDVSKNQMGANVFKTVIKLTDSPFAGLTEFRSWRTSLLPFSGVPSPDTPLDSYIQHLQNIRISSEALFHHVCDNGGGWTIIGWYRVASNDDQSAAAVGVTETNGIMSSTSKFHVVYFAPTNPNVMTTNATKALLFNTSDLLS